MKRKSFVSLCTGTLCASAAVSLSPMTALADVHSPSMKEKPIVFNQRLISKPYGFVHDNTTYIPIWYLMQTLHKLNIHSTWHHNTWNLATTRSINLSHLQPGTGSTAICVNGHLVQKVNEVRAVDPASGQMTTYIPEWYVMKVLNRLHIDSKWNGNVWYISTSSRAVSTNRNFSAKPHTLRYAHRPHRADSANIGQVISKSDLQPGDLVFFNTDGSNLSHDGIYVGDGKFISATTSHGVQIRDLNDPYYWGPRFTRATNPGV